MSVCLHEYRNLLRRLLTLWRSETRQLRIKRIEQSTNVSIVMMYSHSHTQTRIQTAIQTCTAQYQQQLQQANAELSAARAELQQLKASRVKVEDDLKQAFMRGVMALNRQALSVLHGPASDTNIPSEIPTIPPSLAEHEQSLPITRDIAETVQQHMPISVNPSYVCMLSHWLTIIRTSVSSSFTQAPPAYNPSAISVSVAVPSHTTPSVSRTHIIQPSVPTIRTPKRVPHRIPDRDSTVSVRSTPQLQQQHDRTASEEFPFTITRAKPVVVPASSLARHGSERTQSIVQRASVSRQ